MLGVINVFKPQGKTSHDIVNFVRRQLNMKRIGHIGTLDPMAEGVLPILVGKATKLSDYLAAQRKTYVATVRLGIVTDTYDMTGTVLERNEVSVTKQEIQEVLKQFQGEIEQLPPMYSAIKIDGQKLYQLARKGIEVERKPRKIHIYELNLLDMNLEKDEFTIEVDCSKGTYIRSLCFDIGEKLGCGGCMAALVRSKNGGFLLENTFSLEEIEKAAKENAICDLLISVDDILKEVKPVQINEDYAVKITNGLRLRPEQLDITEFSVNEQFRIYHKNQLLCLSSVILENNIYVLKMEMSFY